MDCHYLAAVWTLGILSAWAQCNVVIIKVIKQQQNMSTCLLQIYREKVTVLPHALWACHRGSHFSAAPLLSDVVKRHGLLMQKKNTHFLKMKCFERNGWWRESPFAETSNINSQRESSVGDKNQFHKVWSFPSAGTTKCMSWQTTSQMVCTYKVYCIESRMYYFNV